MQSVASQLANFLNDGSVFLKANGSGSTPSVKRAGDSIEYTQRAVTARLIQAGWHPNRNVWNRLKLPQSFDVFPEAKRILSEFGDLSFADRAEHVLLDPSSGNDEFCRLRECESFLGRRLYPLGYRVHQDREYFFVDENGIIYLLAGDTLEPWASSFEKALDPILQMATHGNDDDLRSIGLEEKTWQLSETPEF